MTPDGRAMVATPRPPIGARMAAAGQVLRSLVGLVREGSWRGPFFGLTEFGNWRELNPLEDGWQKNLRLDPQMARLVPVVAAIRHLHRSAFAQLRPQHMRKAEDGTITHVTTSAAARVLLNPNAYETWSDHAARVVDQWLAIGEVAVLGLRNGREEIDALHAMPRDAWQLMIDPESRAIFYGISDSGQLLTEADLSGAVPARNVLHLRWSVPRHPLIGESALAAAGVAAGIHVALSRSQAAFFTQMARPSGVLSTDHILDGPQIDMLRAKFQEQTASMAQGGIPILAGGLKWNAMSITSADAEVINTLRMGNEEIARTCGVPPPLVGDLSHGSVTSTEALISTWLSISLGGLIERYERALDRLFGLDGETNWIDLDVSALLRSDFAARMDALSKGVQGAVLTPNDARRREGLSPVDGGDALFIQKQNVPVDLASELAAADLKKLQEPPPPPPPPLAPPPAPPPGDDTPPEDVARAVIRAAAHKTMEAPR